MGERFKATKKGVQVDGREEEHLPLRDQRKERTGGRGYGIFLFESS